MKLRLTWARVIPSPSATSRRQWSRRPTPDSRRAKTHATVCKGIHYPSTCRRADIDSWHNTSNILHIGPRWMTGSFDTTTYMSGKLSNSEYRTSVLFLAEWVTARQKVKQQIQDLSGRGQESAWIVTVGGDFRYLLVGLFWCTSRLVVRNKEARHVLCEGFLTVEKTRG